MKTKKEILKMNKKELENYKWNKDLDNKKENINCSNCHNCSDCSYCSDCYDCYDGSYCYKCSYCHNCSDCYECSNCSECYNCSYCFMCRNLKDGKKHQYKICNVQLTKEEYEKKLKEVE